MKHNRTTLRSGAAMAEFVDFHHVPERQREIDARLINWARWCVGASGGYSRTCHPMFRGYRAGYRQSADGGCTAAPDSLDALKVQKVVVHLPEKIRCALQWCYVIRSDPSRCARELAVSRPALFQLIVDGRDMARNCLSAEVRE